MRRKGLPPGFELLRDKKLRMFGDSEDRDAGGRRLRTCAAKPQRVQRGLHRTEDVLDAAQGTAVLEAEDGVFRKGTRPFASLELVLSICGVFFSSAFQCGAVVRSATNDAANMKRTDLL